MKIVIICFLFICACYASNISVIKVEGMHCPLCTTAVKKAIKKLDGIQKVSVLLNTKEVMVMYEEKVKLEDILMAIKTTSYEGVEISSQKQ